MAARGTLICYVRANDTLDQPLVPASWDVIPEDSRWCSVYPLGREARPDIYFHCRLMVRRTATTPDRGLFVCVGTPAVLQHLADRIAADGLAFTLTWPSLAALRADATPAVVTLRSEYPDERPTGDAGTVVRLFARMAGWLDDDGESDG